MPAPGMGVLSPPSPSALNEIELAPTPRQASEREATGSPREVAQVKKGGRQRGVVAPNRGKKHQVNKRETAWANWVIQRDKAGLTKGITALKSEAAVPILDLIAEVVDAPGGKTPRHKRVPS